MAALPFKDYVLLEHTADIGIRIRAHDLDQIFQRAALDMFDIIAERTVAGNDAHIPMLITQEAEDKEELFVNWLNELLSLASAKEVIFTSFETVRCEEKILVMRACAETSSNFRFNVEIKAATYHQLQILQDNSELTAEVIFDV